MTFRYRPKLVSMYTTPAALESHEYYDRISYRAPEFKVFKDAVASAMGDVRFHNIDYASAVVYRKGDIHALGEIGYKDVRVKGGGSSAPSYYVTAPGIVNENYRSTVWQHAIIATKSMKNAVKQAAERLKRVAPQDSANLTIEDARRIIDKGVTGAHDGARAIFRNLTGEAGYSNKFDNEFFKELRGVTFISAELNQQMSKFYAELDAWREAKGVVEQGVHYVGLSDNYGQLVADTGRCVMGYGAKAEEVTRVAASELPDWMQGRIAVLQLVEPDTYVQGVGLRLDDKVYYILQGDEE